MHSWYSGIPDTRSRCQLHYYVHTGLNWFPAALVHGRLDAPKCHTQPSATSILSLPSVEWHQGREGRSRWHLGLWEQKSHPQRATEQGKGGEVQIESRRKAKQGRASIVTYGAPSLPTGAVGHTTPRPHSQPKLPAGLVTVCKASTSLALEDLFR